MWKHTCVHTYVRTFLHATYQCMYRACASFLYFLFLLYLRTSAVHAVFISQEIIFLVFWIRCGLGFILVLLCGYVSLSLATDTSLSTHFLDQLPRGHGKTWRVCNPEPCQFSIPTAIQHSYQINVRTVQVHLLCCCIQNTSHAQGIYERFL